MPLRDPHDPEGLRDAGRRRTLATLAVTCAAAAAARGALAAGDDDRVDLERLIQVHRRYILDRQLDDGALPDSHDFINPYFANIAIAGLLDIPDDDARDNEAAARRWFTWYLAHADRSDANRWQIRGTIAMYDIRGGSEVARDDASNVDANPGTLLAALLAFARRGGKAAREFVASNHDELREIADVMVALEDHGLTWVKPDYRVKYLIDNCQVLRGYEDGAQLFRMIDDADGTARFEQHAASLRRAIETRLWNAADQSFYYDLDAHDHGQPVDWTAWYAPRGAVSQLFPLIYGVLDPGDPRAVALYRRFNEAFPRWPDLDKPDEFPWSSVSYAAARMGDVARARRFLAAVERRHGRNGYRWPWHLEESGWVLRAAALVRAREGR
ncbi:MAG TPA: hypothetical protein VMU33_09240 [Burkholderiaceae bacterium]|nr:hypothetical protein [Burkholderiaceae bacterium]